MAAVQTQLPYNVIRLDYTNINSKRQNMPYNKKKQLCSNMVEITNWNHLILLLRKLFINYLVVWVDSQCYLYQAICKTEKNKGNAYGSLQ